MNKLECPYCEKQAISILRKLALGPATSARCQYCGEKVSVSFTAMLGGIPFIAAIMAGNFVDAPPFKVLLLIAGLALTSVIHLRLIPLTR